MSARFLAYLFACVIAAPCLHAQEGGAFLKLPMSVRAAGMGDAYAAVSDEPLGIYYNPAGMVFSKRQTVSFAYHSYMQDISGNSLAFVSPYKNWAVGLAPAVFSMKEEPVYDSLGNDTGNKFSYKRTIIPAAAAYRLGNLGLGLTVKYYGEEIGGQTSGTTAFDAGAVYRFAAWRFGLSAQNYGGGSCSDQKCALEMGGILDVGMMFTGSISKDAEGYSVIVTAVDIKTGKLAASYEEKALLEIELKDICSKMPKKMFQPGY